MVEFKLKTLATQDTSIDKSNPDMYDGGSGYILVGDKIETKIGLFRFPIAEKPTYGDAALKSGSLGFYNISTSSNSGSNLPQFSIYKMKTSADGLDWGAGGTINPVKRGKVISAVNTTTNVITVENHQLRTGEPITYSPFVRFYGDAALTGIDREIEYYAIRIDNNTLQFSETAATALAGTAESISGSTGVVYKNNRVTPSINETRYGYLRSRKYRSDIHIVSSWADNYESLVETFDGSQRRESELDFQAVQRQVLRRDKQHLVNTTKEFGDQIHSSKSEDSEPNCGHSESSLKASYATDVDGQKKMYLDSHQTNSDGGGWWGLHKSGKKSPSHYVRKRKPFKSATPNSDVKYDGETLIGRERYGDEITPMNSLFQTVRGAREFQQASETEEGENVLQATGAVRFSTEKKLTGGQSCNFYHFWKYQGEGVAYTSPHGFNNAKYLELFKGQECMVQYKNLPCPSVTMGLAMPNELVGYEGAGQLPLGDGDANSENYNKVYDTQTMSLKITMNIAKMAKAFSTNEVSGSDGTPSISDDKDDIILNRRGMFVCLSASPVGKGESLYEFITRLGGRGDSTYNDATNWTDHKPISRPMAQDGAIEDNTTDNLSAMAFWVVNTSLGLQVIPLRPGASTYYSTSSQYYDTRIDRTNEDFYLKNLYNSEADDQYIKSVQEDIGTDLGEDEWADWIIRYSPVTKSANLHIVSRDGFELLPASIDDTEETNSKDGMELTNIKEERFSMPEAQCPIAVPGVFTSSSHGLSDGDALIYHDGGGTRLFTAPAVYDAARMYVEVINANTFYLHEEATTAIAHTTASRAEIKGVGNDAQFFFKDDVGRLGHDPSSWTKNLSIWTFNSMSNYSTNTSGQADDWFHGDDNADMETSIFIDSISVNGINMSHQNNTLSDDNDSSTIRIAGGDNTNATLWGEGQRFTSNSASMARIGKKSDSFISLGFEDPSQISSEHLCKKSWRYLYWQGYNSSNLTSDGPIAWTAGGTLPADTYLDTASIEGDENRDWFSPVDQTNWTDARFDEAYSDIWYHDAGSPFTYSTLVSTWGNLEAATGAVNVSGGMDDTTTLVVDTNVRTIKVGDVVTGTGIVGTPSIVTVTDQQNLVLSSAQTLDDDVALYFNKVSPVTSPSWAVSYSDAHVSLGAQVSNEALNHRNLYYNRTTQAATANKVGTTSSTALVVDGNVGTIEVGDVIQGTGVAFGTTVATVTDQQNLVMSSSQTISDDVALKFVNNEKSGGAGTGERMFITSPGIGVTFRGQTDVHSPGSPNEIVIYGGSYGSTAHNWSTGHKVVYYNNGLGNIQIGGEDAESVDNTFRDTPTIYYIVNNTVGDANKFKLASSYTNAIANTTLTVGDSSSDGLHLFYDYDYYVNKKYWMNGWESKGFSRLMLQPTQTATTAIIKPYYIDNLGEGGGSGSSTPSYTDLIPTATANGDGLTSLYLTKRENIQCSAKVLEVLEKPSTELTDASSGKMGTITLKVDTTEPLFSTVGTTYRAYLIAKGTITKGTAASGQHCIGEGTVHTDGSTIGGDADNYKSGLTISFVDHDVITIDGWSGYGTTGDINLISDDNLPSLWIGPEKYWVYFKITNRTGDTADTFRTLPNKTYRTLEVVSPYGGDSTTWADNDAWGTPGATFNESTANFETVGGIPSAYVNQWIPQPDLNPSETIFDLQDYGFGAPAAAKDDDSSAWNGVRGGQAASFVPRDNQINMVNMPKVFNVGEKKVEGDYLDLALTTDDESIDSTLVVSSTDNVSLPKPFLLTVFEDVKPANPTGFKVIPFEKDAFFPEFKWSASDGDLWYGFIILDDMPINSQYHRSILHVPLNEDLRNTSSSYDDTKGWYYADSTSPVIYGYRYYNTSLVDPDRRPLNKLDTSTWSTNFALSGGGTEKITAKGIKIYDNVEGLAGNTKYFDKDGGNYVEFPFSATVAANSAFTYPRDEMSVLAHVTPVSWADSGERAYIASFNESTDTTANFDAWGLYMDDEGRVNAFVGAEPDDGTQSTFITLKSTTKMPIDGSPTCVILTVDTQIHSGNVKLFINGRLEDQTGLRGTLSTNNWPTDSLGKGGDAIFFDIDSTTYGLFIGAKAQDGSQVGQSPFNGKIEEFVWYDKVIYPVTPQDGKFVLEKPLEELVSGSTNSSSKSHTARLFIKDYHNIRGKTTGEVAASSQISFKKAAFELYT